MKKILFVMMILLGISAFSSNSYEADLVGRMKVLEEKVQYQLDSRITADVNNAINELSEAWETELNTVYSLLMEKLPKQDKIKLEDEQKTWLKNRNIEARKAAKETEKGTLEPVLYDSSIRNLNKKRTIELARRYDKLMNKE